MKNKIYMFIFLSIFIYHSAFITYSKAHIEDLEVPLGVGLDISKDNFSEVQDISVSTYIFEKEDNALVKVRNGKGITFGETRENRQVKEDKQYIIGQEKVYIVSEDFARNGLKAYFDYVFKSSSINDKAKVVVCQGNASELLKFNLHNSINSVEFIDGLTTIIDDQNFNTKEIKVIDVYSRLVSKYRKLILPYISKTEEGIEVTGYALFNGDKMERKIDSGEAKILNLLRAESGYGDISIIYSQSKALDLYGKKKGKIECIKEKEEYHFTINLDFKMQLITNTFNDKLNSDDKVRKEAEKLAEKQVEEECNDFIRKMQQVYKMDYLELARVAAAKYREPSDVNWDKVICDSKINVKVKVEINEYGRGDY